MKANVVLSSADEEEEQWENLAACRHYLNEADKAMAECKELYRSAEEVRHLEVLEGYIIEEHQALRERESDSEGDSLLAYLRGPADICAEQNSIIASLLSTLRFRSFYMLYITSKLK
jgi:hypothetical protein